MKKLSKTEAKERVEELFKDVKNKSPKEIKKIKKLAMSYNIKIGDKRKKFCGKCYSSKLKLIGVKNKVKRVKCESCENVSRWKIK
jgi:ribosomal protein L5